MEDFLNVINMFFDNKWVKSAIVIAIAILIYSIIKKHIYYI